MHRLFRPTRRAAVLLLALAAAASTPAADKRRAPVPVRSQDQAPLKCCFTNPGYSGTCEVQPAKEETCSQILDYLNNPMAQGKSYCGSTQVRSGWKSAACEPPPAR
jgi:hypothetical protein